MHAFPPIDTYRPLIQMALREDVGSGDVTSQLLVPEDARGVGTLLQKAVGVVCGLPIVEQVCAAFDEQLRVEMIPGFHLELIEGRFSEQKQTPLMRIRGPMRSLLAAERTVLNFLQHMSGVATMTHRFVRRVEGTRAKLVDTRKTRPGYRALDKYAVRVGGGVNHRAGLFDMVLVKDNHLAQLDPASGFDTMRDLLKRSKRERPDVKVEVEVVSVEQFKRVLTMEAVDFILLDNMDCPTMAECVQLRDAARSRIELEASGGVTLETVRDIARTGVDRISVGAVTHSAPSLDISLEIEPE